MAKDKKKDAACVKSPLDRIGLRPYSQPMTSNQIVDELLALPLEERVALAQTLWQSIHEAPDLDAAEEERAAIAEARRRDNELDSGIVTGRRHEQVMEAARQTLG